MRTVSMSAGLLGPRQARRVGLALVAYGAAGLLILAILVTAALPMTTTLDNLSRSAAEVSDTLAATRDAFDGFNTSLLEAQRSAERAAAAARSSARAASGLADGMTVSIFGVQPLVSLSANFRQQSDDLTALAATLDQLGLSLARDAVDVRAIRAEVAMLHSRVSAIGTSEATSPWLVPALALLFAWLAIVPVAALLFGASLLRRG
jgi:hypothetical protein